MEEKTYRISVYPHAGKALSQSLDSCVVDGFVLVYTGAKPTERISQVVRFNSSFSERYSEFLTNQGKTVYTNLPVLIEEE